MTKRKVQILIADAEDFVRKGMREALHKAEFNVEMSADGYQTLRMIREKSYELVVMDLGIPGPGGMELLEEIHDTDPDSHIIVLTAHGNISTAVEAMKKGAYDFIAKPLDLAHLRLLVERALGRVELVAANRQLQSRLENRDSFRKIVRRSSAMQAAATTIKQVAMSNVAVFLRGETGVGKDLIARAIHERSRRRDGPLVAVNCGGFPEELFASELFGHVRGAFTGAHTDKPGRFALAEGGTLFLDEIGEVPLKNQVELLRALENCEYQLVGDSKVRRADVRIIAATNRDLETDVEQGHFREDLYYRLNVVPIDIPPLRQRHEDIPVLVEIFLEEACRAHSQTLKRVAPESMEHFISHSWPGNVRELRNLIQRLVVTCQGKTIRPEHLPGILAASDDGLGQFTVKLGTSVQETEAELIRQTLRRVTSNRRRAASILGISLRSLQYKLKQYGIL